MPAVWWLSPRIGRGDRLGKTFRNVENVEMDLGFVVFQVHCGVQRAEEKKPQNSKITVVNGSPGPAATGYRWHGTIFINLGIWASPSPRRNWIAHL